MFQKSLCSAQWLLHCELHSDFWNTLYCTFDHQSNSKLLLWRGGCRIAERWTVSSVEACSLGRLQDILIELRPAYQRDISVCSLLVCDHSSHQTWPTHTPSCNWHWETSTTLSNRLLVVRTQRFFLGLGYLICCDSWQSSALKGTGKSKKCRQNVK